MEGGVCVPRSFNKVHETAPQEGKRRKNVVSFSVSFDQVQAFKSRTMEPLGSIRAVSESGLIR